MQSQWQVRVKSDNCPRNNGGTARSSIHGNGVTHAGLWYTWTAILLLAALVPGVGEAQSTAPRHGRGEAPSSSMFGEGKFVPARVSRGRSVLLPRDSSAETSKTFGFVADARKGVTMAQSSSNGISLRVRAQGSAIEVEVVNRTNRVVSVDRDLTIGFEWVFYGIDGEQIRPEEGAFCPAIGKDEARSRFVTVNPGERFTGVRDLRSEFREYWQVQGFLRPQSEDEPIGQEVFQSGEHMAAIPDISKVWRVQIGLMGRPSLLNVPENLAGGRVYVSLGIPATE